MSIKGSDGVSAVRRGKVIGLASNFKGPAGPGDESDDPLLLRCLAFPVDTFNACFTRLNDTADWDGGLSVKFTLNRDVKIKQES